MKFVEPVRNRQAFDLLAVDCTRQRGERIAVIFLLNHRLGHTVVAFGLYVLWRQYRVAVVVDSVVDRADVDVPIRVIFQALHHAVSMVPAPVCRNENDPAAIFAKYWPDIVPGSRVAERPF